MNILEFLYNLIMTLAKYMGNVWEFLNNPLTIKDITIFGTTIIDFPEFIPIQLIGPGIVFLITLWFIKSLIPMA